MKKRTLLFLLIVICVSSSSVLAGSFFKFEGSELENTKDIIYANPVTPHPSPEARALLNYLYSIYGQKMLAGQMESIWVDGPDYELNYIKEHTGKLPAIRGLDFINEEDNDNVVQRAIDWWRRGGIPTIMWHWGAPTIGEGYEASKGTIDIEAALTPGTAEYKAMMADLDRIADHLQKLKEANVPIIWRPLHEHNGGWFWWSKGGPEQFNRLWRFMFNYFVNERGLNNLIWVLGYTSEADPAWYPGEEYVDLAGADTYDGGAEPRVRMFNSVRKVVGLNEPVVYHECGVMPDPELSKEQGVHWSWFMTWHTTWLTDNNPIDHIKDVYNSKFVLTLDELPNVMDYAGTGESTIARVSTMVEGAGVITKDPAANIVKKGTAVTFTAVPKEGWEFVEWGGVSTSTANPIELEVNENVGLFAKFVPVSGTNLLENGDFSDGLNHWSNYNFTDQGASASIDVIDGKCVVSIKTAGKERYHVQLIRPDISLKKGKKYQLSFDAYAQNQRKAYVKIGQQGGDYLEYFGETFSLSTAPKTFTRTFAMTEKSDNNSRLEFNVGLEGSNVYIDNVSISIVE